MRVKTSVTLPKDLLSRIDHVETNRSAFLEKASRAYLASLERARRNAHDLQILNANADRLNAEAMDALEYQVDL
jgi:metal-responsive CopG/Arc/MetJ family transcriptional regulator